MSRYRPEIEPPPDWPNPPAGERQTSERRDARFAQPPLRDPAARLDRAQWREHLLWRALSLALSALLLLGLVVGIEAWERASRVAPVGAAPAPAPPSALEWRVPQAAPVLTTSEVPLADPIAWSGGLRRCYVIERVMIQDGRRVVAEGRVCLVEP